MIETPIIILINPQMGENIGAAARAAKNFGLAELRIVAPRDGWPNPKAVDMAAGAADILEKAQLFNTTAEAIADTQRVYATTSRDRYMNKPVVTVRELFTSNHSASHNRSAQNNETIKTAILFGPERTGLTNEDITLADAILSIPVDPAYPSLNLAQAVNIVGYEWYLSRHSGESRDPEIVARDSCFRRNPEFATKAELQSLFDHLQTELDTGDFWKVPEKKSIMWRNIRSTIQRTNLTAQEVRTLHGIIRCLTSPKS